VGAFVVPAKVEVVARYAQIQRLVDPTLERAQASGLGVAQLVRDGESVIGLERCISELTVGLNYFINEWHRHKLQAVVTRLQRTFAADTEAGIARARAQEDMAVSVQVQLVF
jgi:hypothetical protein